MSRKTKKHEHFTVNGGDDHAIGYWCDIQDKRYANSGKDEQGEGYIYEWSHLFDVGINLASLTIEEAEALCTAVFAQKFDKKNVQLNSAIAKIDEFINNLNK